MYVFDRVFAIIAFVSVFDLYGKYQNLSSWTHSPSELFNFVIDVLFLCRFSPVSQLSIVLFCDGELDTLHMVNVMRGQRLHHMLTTIHLWLSESISVSVDKWQAGGAVSKVKLH